jgi:hypothetical protein
MLDVTAFGLRLQVESDVPDLAALLAARLPPFEPAGGDQRCARRYAVLRDGVGVLSRCGRQLPRRVETPSDAADLVVADLQRFVALRAEGLVFVHAGVVAWRGRALLLPGRSGSGKSRLVAALVWAGAQYLSDEMAVLDACGSVLPYPRPLALRLADGSHQRLAAERLPSPPALRPVTTSCVAFVRYRAGARWSPRRLSAGEAFLGLLRHTMAARRRFDLAQALLRPIAASAHALSSPRGQAEAVAADLLRILEEASTPMPGDGEP